ncbi:glycoside hydrolase family 2 TIM barrel-domain containing protein [Clostridium perfringens]|uniref:glycoside hydrolase family 2 TIM barrel-domain containing protein n=1 Tax=Clostridium perfringens TaxID=1502 RepID=UPI0024BD3AC7|nr:glycoside hydrolase family 2 TIM barrel-domain containing protein [Clostridium perfringens]
MQSFNKRGTALGAAIAFALTLAPTLVMAETRQIPESETVNVGFIKDGERSTIFNQNWKFFKGDPSGAEGVDFDDSSWRGLNLPHDWSIEGDFTVEGEAESGFLLGGTGWYRKAFVVPEKYNGKDFTLNFDGVYMNAEVYVNGRKVGEHNYGYTSFAFDITEALICDGQTENIIAVKVSNPVPTSRWYSGSGIYRDVTLSVTDSIHVAHSGTTVTTPKLEEQKGGNVDVAIETIIENESKDNSMVTVKSTVVNSRGEEVSEAVINEQSIGANESYTFNQTAIVNNPDLWSVDNPNVYKVKSEVLVDGKVIDTYFTDFGFRYYNFDKDTGFSLNGENMKLKGVCMHHDQGALGAASYYRAVERQMEKMKEMGVNAIRVSHNPASEMLLEICNRLGLLVINEAFDTWTNPKNGNVNDFSKYFNEVIGEDNEILNGSPEMTWGEFEARSMVKNSKNNPSIIMWSIGNEVLEGISGSASNYTNVAQNIIDWIKDEDETRHVTIGDNRTKNGDRTAEAISEVVDDNGGLVGFNYANEAQVAQQRANHPDWTLYASETSSAIHTRGYYKTKGIDYSNHRISEYDNNQTRVGWGHSASDAWKFVIKNDYNAGEFVWTGFDYIGEPTPWNGTGTGTVGGGNGAAPKSSYFGIVDTAGFEKDIYYLYQSQWNDDVNTLHVLPTWNREDIVIENGNVEVNVFTDAHKVELYLNDEKIGEQTSTEHTTDAGYKYYTFGNDSLYPVFNVPYEEGTLTAKAYDKEGNEITNTEGRNTVKTTGEASTVRLSADRDTIDSDGYDLSYITVDIVDENGNIVQNADNRLNFELEGNGKIVGVDNGDQTDTDSYKPTSDTEASRKALSGKALVIVQSTKDAGNIRLNVSGEGLQSQSIEINTVNNAGEDKFLESYEIVKDYYVNLNEKPELPSTVEGRYSDGTTETFNISWNDYDESQLNTPQVFKINGKLEGTDVAVNVNVHVIGDVVSMENYSTFTYAGQTPTLPKTVKGYLADGNESEEFKVDWNLEGIDFSEPNTTVEVLGEVSLLGKTYTVTSTVRVVEALKAAANLAINNSSNKDVPALSQSCVSTADNLNSINNGITNNGTDTRERWTNWNERDLTVNGEPKGAYVQLDWENKYNIDRLDLWLFTDNIYGRIPKKVEISYKNEAGEYEVVTHSNTTEVSYLAGETTYFLDKVINTDSIRVYMQQPEVGKCIGLSEVAVYEYVPQVSANEGNKLSEIKLDGEVLEGFNPDTNEYTVNLKELPKTVEASGEENVAVTILPVHNNKSIIIARSESGAKNIYTVNYVLEESEGSADINEDGSINVGDLSIVSKYQGEVISGNALSEKSDINKDGVVDKADIQIVMDKILGE